MTAQQKTKLSDLLERVFWTAASVILGMIPAAVGEIVLDLDLAGGVIAAITIGSTAAANGLLVVVRWKLDILPNPGDGLPGYPTEGDA